MLELLFLLLPVAAVYGFYMGRIFTRSKKQDSRNEQNSNYLRGVEYLLDNRSEKAVDKFIAYLNGTDQTFESGLALGNLFRKRGEVDKAITLHEKMALDAKLEDSEHELAQLELARDFIGAGLLDRAETILLKSVEIPRQRARAASLLLTVYEREQDYGRAIEIGLKFRDALGRSADRQLGQYYCEQAAEKLNAGALEEAKAGYRSAMDVYPKSLRALLGLAELFIREKNYAEAYKLVKSASELDPKSGLLCLEYLERCFPNQADPKYRFALEDLVHKTHSAAAMVDLVNLTASEQGVSDAEAMLLTFIKEKPNLKLFSALMGLRSGYEDPRANNAIMQLKSLVDAAVVSNPRYSCHHCGFESKMMFWQCPSCRTWESLKPKVGLDGD